MLATLRHYSFFKLRKDMVAGLTVSVVEVPQAMAYALIAGVPPEYGLYTAVMQGVLSALLSSSSHLISGPTNTSSLLIAAAVHRLVADPAEPVYLELVFCLTVFKGVILLAFSAARMGNITRYVSRSVISGVTAGAGVLILIGQLPHFLGLTIPPAATTWPGAFGYVQRYLPHLDEINGQATAVGMLALLVILIAPRLWRFLPGALLAMGMAAAGVWVLNWTTAELPLVGVLPRAFPGFHMPRPTLPQVEALFSGALALAILGMLESVAISKAIASHTGERVDPNREFFSQGLLNTVTGFFQCIPGSGSFTRSALNYSAGAQTRFSALFNAAFVILIFMIGARLAGYIPMASLAAVIMLIAWRMIDWQYLTRVWRADRSDAVVFLLTFASTMLLPLQYAVLVGVFLNLALFVRQATQLHLAEMVPTDAGPFLERPLHDRAGQHRVMFLQAEGDLFFGVADELQARLDHLGRGRVQVVIFRLKRTHSIDSTVLAVLEEFARQMQRRGGAVLLCGVRPELMNVMRSFGLLRVIGEENVFEAGYGVFTSAKRALERARKLIGESIDDEGVNTEDELEGWAYQI